MRSVALVVAAWGFVRFALVLFTHKRRGYCTCFGQFGIICSFVVLGNFGHNLGRNFVDHQFGRHIIGAQFAQSIKPARHHGFADAKRIGNLRIGLIGLEPIEQYCVLCICSTGDTH